MGGSHQADGNGKKAVPNAACQQESGMMKDGCRFLVGI
jgi:hypothetical protein